MSEERFIVIDYGLQKSPWNLVPLTDYVFFQEGPGLRHWQWTEEGMKVINITNILGEGVVNTTNTKRHISENEFLSKYKHFEVDDGDIVIASSGWSYAKIGRIKQSNLPLMMNTSVIRFRSKNKKELYDDFLFHFLRSKYMRNQIDSLITIADKPNFGPVHIKRMSIPLPDFSTQCKIASLLSAYDDLIENNLNRIKLLEEKAQLHYKVLIQEMSFDIVKREEHIKDCLSFYIGGGWGEEEYKEGFAEAAFVIRGTDIPDARGGNITGIPLRYHKASNLASRKMLVGDIVFEISNGQINNIGRSVLISHKLLGQFNAPVMCASFAKLIRVNERISPEFFYLYLNESQQNGLLYQYKSNSANGINNFAFETFIDEVKITLPKANELKSFTERVSPIFTFISVLGEQNTKLREARDILLPRLMSGEIEV